MKTRKRMSGGKKVVALYSFCVLFDHRTTPLEGGATARRKGPEVGWWNVLGDRQGKKKENEDSQRFRSRCFRSRSSPSLYEDEEIESERKESVLANSLAIATLWLRKGTIAWPRSAMLRDLRLKLRITAKNEGISFLCTGAISLST